MARRGWVSVTDPTGDRWRLAVFDDGWVELPGFGPAPSDGHIVQRTLLVLLGSLGVLVLLSQLAGRLDSGSSETSLVLSAAGLAAVLVSVLLQDGSVRTYRTPDRGAVELFAPWTR